MRSILVLSLLVFQISFGQHPVCSTNEPATLVKVADLPIKKNNGFKFKINNYANYATIVRNGNGTFILGDYSTLVLATDKNQYEYISTAISFKYPPQHRIVEVNTEILELQIVYELKSTHNPAWKHRNIALSVNFLLTEFAPQQTFTLGKEINADLRNGSLFDLRSLLRLLPSLPMILYKGTHTDYPEDNGFLWLVRKQLLLMSQFQLQQVKSFIYSGGREVQYHGVKERRSVLNEIQQMQVKEMVIKDIVSQ